MRVALYCRVSTEEQSRHGLSLAEQEKSLKEYAQNNDMTIVDTYIDAGISARKKYTKRPELLRLLSDVEAGLIDMVLFIKLDRWFRSVADYYEVQKILDSHNVTWRATQEDYETVTASGRFKVNIMLSVAQDEADRTSERIRFVFDGKRERGEPLGKLPLGYLWDGEHVIIDDSKPMRAMFDLYLETGEALKVIDSFPELNLNYLKLRRIIENPAYYGKSPYLDIPPIISEKEYARLQELRKKSIRKTSHNRVYLFTGLINCPTCGGRMGGKAGRTRNDGSMLLYYTCGKYVCRTGCDNNVLYKEPVIEDYLLSHIDSKIQSLVETEPERVTYKPQRDAVERKLAKLADLYVNDLISMGDYKKQYQELNSQLAAIPRDPDPIDMDMIQSTFFPDWQDIYRELPREDKRAFWRGTLKEILLNFDGTVKDFVLL